MNKLKLTAIAALIGIFTATAQKSNAIQKVYDTYESKENVLSLSLGTNLKDAIDTDFEWGDQLKNMEGDITKMSTLIISENSESKQMLSDMQKMIKKLGYGTMDLPDDTETENEVYLFTRGSKGHYSEIHVLMIDNDGSGVLLSMFGDFIVKSAS